MSNPSLPELGQINGGLSFLIKDVLGSGLGTLFLANVILAIFVCALAVHAGTVRLVFAMARDNNLPFARSLGHVPERTHAPILPPLLIGGLAATLLILNINLPQVIETLCAVAIIWVNLAYLMVTFPMLVARFRRRRPRAARRVATQAEAGGDVQRLFSMGRFGLPVNALAVAWGVFIVVNISWPRIQIYGADPWGRFAAPLSTLALLAVGAVYYQLVQRRKTGILVEHAYSVVSGQIDTGQWPVASGE